jgi:DNA polymerase III epsilon subunit-like protein
MFAPDLKNAMDFVSKKLAGTVQVSHNLTFDSAFIEKSFERAGLENPMLRYKLDTISIAFARLYNRRDVKYSLRYLCDLFQIKNENAHTALADARALYEVYKKMMNA